MPPDVKELTYAQAINSALKRALDEWPEVIVLGEDVARPGGVFGVTKGLQNSYDSRVIDTPISESAILGAALGAGMVGRRPVAEIMWMDFLLVGLDQLVNQAANLAYINRGRLASRLTVRTQQGIAPGACAQHSQSLEALLVHIPGLRICMPSSAQDAYDLLLSAIQCDDPVVVIENRNLYHGRKEHVCTGSPIAPIGGSRIVRPGEDVTIIGWGASVAVATSAATDLRSQGISAEVIDARWIAPFDYGAVFASVRKTRRLAVVHEANLTGAFSAQIVASISEAGIHLASPPIRLGLPDVRIPAAPSLLNPMRPSIESVSRSVIRLLSV